MSSAVGSFIAIKFIQLYFKPFDKWEAFKLGLIDKNGVKIRDAKNSKEEKEFVTWKNLIRKLKIILNKVPLGEFGKRLATLASAFWLLKEELDKEGHDGQEIINNLYEEIIKDHKELIAEENPTITILPGKYAINGLSGLVNVKEIQKPIGRIFGQNIFEVTEFLSGKSMFVTINELKDLYE